MPIGTLAEFHGAVDSLKRALAEFHHRQDLIAC